MASTEFFRNLEKNTCENRVFGHRLSHFSVKCSIWVNFGNIVCHLPGFYEHWYWFYVLYRPFPYGVSGIFRKFLLVFEKNTCENRVFGHRLSHFSVKYPVWVNFGNIVCHLPGFYEHWYWFYVLYRPFPYGVSGIFRKYLLVFEKNTYENRVFDHRLSHFLMKCPIWVNLRNIVRHVLCQFDSNKTWNGASIQKYPGNSLTFFFSNLILSGQNLFFF